ncbi:MAG: transketolase [Erysipelotrichales bacterium]|nr:transketolase [Erysipelotrichales bacterium]
MKEWYKEWKKLAVEMRKKILMMCSEANSGHPGGALSCVEILIVLLEKTMKYESPEDPNRDRFIFSKGHAVPALYAYLLEKGYFEPEEIHTFRKYGTRLQGHPIKEKCPFTDFNPGSLGQGVSAATGMALGYKMKNDPRKVYVLIGDGESDEGIVWEAASAAAHYHLDHLTYIVDLNAVQLDGTTAEIMNLGDLKKRYEAIGFLADEINGHDFEELVKAFEHHEEGKPHVILAHTIKGKGVSYMEGNCEWHGKAPNAEQLAIALKELEESSHE